MIDPYRLFVLYVHYLQSGVNDFLRRVKRFEFRGHQVVRYVRTDRVRIPMNVIERTSAEPYYAQLARILEAQIKEGGFRPGDRLPGETELCRTYELARSTVRETLRALEQQRLIRMVPRRGAFVNDVEANRWMLQVTQGFLETEAHAPDRTIVTQVLKAAFEPLPVEVTTALNMDKGERGFVLERVRTMDGKPAMHSTNWLPADVGAVLLGKPVLQGQESLKLYPSESRLFGLFRSPRSRGDRNAGKHSTATELEEESAHPPDPFRVA